MVIVDVDFVPLSGIRAISFSFDCSCLGLFGGRGGKLEGSYTGTLSLEPPSIEGARDAEVLAVPLDTAETDDTVENTDDIDSVESRLLSCSEGFRGGNAGEVCDCWTDVLLGGSLGGGGASPDGFLDWPVRATVGGGRTGRFGPSGSLPMPLSSE